MSKEREIAYVVHPVSQKLKEKLRADGFKIIDARFAPEDAKVINPHKKRGKDDSQQQPTQPSDKGIGTDSGNQFSEEQLRAAIETATGKAPHPSAKLETLIDKFNELNAQAASE
ncbi:hypothetical protein [Brucella intermedia]|uniref:hypothetical protein n=1 Tax=Brucella intermedia TaxID=94625 RepID=UPI000988C4A9|nr:hypothetical protein [Brucella intermedia]OOC51208.1 hypothetical protein AS855_01180 [Brucella intermedia M86]